MIYLDNGATSFPKPPGVAEAVSAFLTGIGANPGRSGYGKSMDAAKIVYQTREVVNDFFGGPDPLRVVFTHNATYGINIALKGLLAGKLKNFPEGSLRRPTAGPAETAGPAAGPAETAGPAGTKETVPPPVCRVITTGMEHNAVIRPLRALEAKGVEIVVVSCGSDGTLDLGALERALQEGCVRCTDTNANEGRRNEASRNAGQRNEGQRNNPIKADLLIMTAVSNITGTVMPVAEAGRLARKYGVPFFVDAAQGGGVTDLNMERDNIDILAFTGHKGLYGPPGTGGIIFGPEIDEKRIEPLIEGGTGSRSEAEYQPMFMPDRFESGTANGPGLAGLHAGISWIIEKGRAEIVRHERELAAMLIAGLQEIPGVVVYGPQETNNRTGIVSFTMDGCTDGCGCDYGNANANDCNCNCNCGDEHSAGTIAGQGPSVAEIGEILDDDYGIMTRVGLHCAPLAHKTIGTFPSGTVRMSIGAFNTVREIETVLAAVADIAERHRKSKGGSGG